MAFSEERKFERENEGQWLNEISRERSLTKREGAQIERSSPEREAFNAASNRAREARANLEAYRMTFGTTTIMQTVAEQVRDDIVDAFKTLALIFRAAYNVFIEKSRLEDEVEKANDEESRTMLRYLEQRNRDSVNPDGVGATPGSGGDVGGGVYAKKGGAGGFGEEGGSREASGGGGGGGGGGVDSTKGPEVHPVNGI